MQLCAYGKAEALPHPLLAKGTSPGRRESCMNIHISGQPLWTWERILINSCIPKLNCWVHRAQEVWDKRCYIREWLQYLQNGGETEVRSENKMSQGIHWILLQWSLARSGTFFWGQNPGDTLDPPSSFPISNPSPVLSHLLPKDLLTPLFLSIPRWHSPGPRLYLSHLGFLPGLFSSPFLPLQSGLPHWIQNHFPFLSFIVENSVDTKIEKSTLNATNPLPSPDHCWLKINLSSSNIIVSKQIILPFRS